MRDFKLEKSTRRRGESGPIPVRKRRFINFGKDWYFVTRNGKRHGPFTYLTTAESELKLFLRRCGIVRTTI